MNFFFSVLKYIFNTFTIIAYVTQNTCRITRLYWQENLLDQEPTCSGILPSLYGGKPGPVQFSGPQNLTWIRLGYHNNEF